MQPPHSPGTPRGVAEKELLEGHGLEQGNKERGHRVRGVRVIRSHRHYTGAPSTS